jgi:hypothetical protein
MASKEVILKGLAFLYGTYPHALNNTTSNDVDLRAELWTDLFAAMDDEVFLASVKKHVTVGKFFPMPAEIFEQYSELKSIADGGNDWSQVWAAIKGAIAFRGSWGTVDEVRKYIGDKLPPAMAQDAEIIIKRLGWRELCNMKDEKEEIWRAQFRDIYNSVRKARVNREEMTPDVARLISDMAQRMAADRLRLNAPKNDEEDEF